LSETLLILMRDEGDIIINVHTSSCSVRYSCMSLIKPEFSRQIFEKSCQILNFMKILSMGAEVFRADGQTNGHDEGNSRFSKFW
jgi:hypothetical protein